jgi:hypothetical protein
MVEATVLRKLEDMVMLTVEDMVMLTVEVTVMVMAMLTVETTVEDMEEDITVLQILDTPGIVPDPLDLIQRYWPSYCVCASVWSSCRDLVSFVCRDVKEH